ncbi:unnamed protein product [Durusdinium trenchii]|uniref:EF-hand domain-containing protein n=1 Tax=Durusdinium trenchii TaxID=1381693 RepID=A0ABP0IL31_9DINO
MTFAVSSNISSQCLSDSEPDVGPSSSKSSRKRSNPGAALHGDFIRAKTAQESSMEFDTHDKLRRSARRLTNNTCFNQFMALVVLFDAYCNCSDIDARAKLQHVPQVLQVGAACCLMLYTLELVLVVFAQGWASLKDWAFYLDLGVIICGCVEYILDLLVESTEVAARIGILRLLRLGRIIRLLQLLRKTRALRELQKLVTMMSTCLKALAWSFIFCFVIMTIWAMLIVEMINPLVQEIHAKYDTFQDCEQCLRATSSVMDANLLLFKTVIAGDSWGTIAVPVIEAYPPTAIIFVGSLLTLVFGVLNLIVAVVVDTFADARDRDILNLAEEMEQDMQADKRFLESVFDRIDVDHTGQLTLEQLVEGARTDTEFQSRLKVMDIDEMDLVQLFEMIDIDNSGFIESNEFIRPLSRWVRDSKTAPRFIKYNMMRTMQKQEELQQEQIALRQAVEVHFAELWQRLEAVQSSFPLPRQDCNSSMNSGPNFNQPMKLWGSANPEEFVEQPHASVKVRLKRMSEAEASVQQAMDRLEELVLRATESALKESKGLVKGVMSEVLVLKDHQREADTAEVAPQANVARPGPDEDSFLSVSLTAEPT